MNLKKLNESLVAVTEILKEDYTSYLGNKNKVFDGQVRYYDPKKFKGMITDKKGGLWDISLNPHNKQHQVWNDKIKEKMPIKFKAVQDPDFLQAIIGDFSFESKMVEKKSSMLMKLTMASYNAYVFFDDNKGYTVNFAGPGNFDTSAMKLPKNDNRWYPKVFDEFKSRIENAGIKSKIDSRDIKVQDFRHEENKDPFTNIVTVGPSVVSKVDDKVCKNYDDSQDICLDKVSEGDASDSEDKRANELLKMFDNKVDISKVIKSVSGEPNDIVVGGITFTYGNRELSAHDEKTGKLYIWSVDNVSGRGNEYSLFDVVKENKDIKMDLKKLNESLDNLGKSLTESSNAGDFAKDLARDTATDVVNSYEYISTAFIKVSAVLKGESKKFIIQAKQDLRDLPKSYLGMFETGIDDKSYMGKMHNDASFQKFKSTKDLVAEINKQNQGNVSDLKTKPEAEAGFDLSSMKVSKFKKLLNAFKLSDKPKRMPGEYGWHWVGPGLTIITNVNPFTGIRDDGGQSQKDYLGYVGLSGTKENVKNAYDLFKKLADDIKDEDPNSRQFI